MSRCARLREIGRRQKYRGPGQMDKNEGNDLNLAYTHTHQHTHTEQLTTNTSTILQQDTRGHDGKVCTLIHVENQATSLHRSQATAHDQPWSRAGQEVVFYGRHKLHPVSGYGDIDVSRRDCDFVSCHRPRLCQREREGKRQSQQVSRLKHHRVATSRLRVLTSGHRVLTGRHRVLTGRHRVLIRQQPVLSTTQLHHAVSTGHQ